MTKRTLLLIIFCAYTSSCVRMAAPPPRQADQDEFEGILRVFSRGEYARASESLEKLLRRPLDSTLQGKATFLLAMSAYRKEEWDRSITFFQKAISMYPPLADYSQYYLAQALQKKGDLLLSIEALDFFIRNHPLSRWRKNAEITMPGLYFSMGNFDSALHHYRNVVSRYPGLEEYPDILFFISRCQEMKGQYEEAARGYLSVWLTFPLSSHAKEARERLDALCLEPRSGPNPSAADSRSGCPSPPSLEDLWKRSQKMVQGSQCKEGEDELRALLLRAAGEGKPDLTAKISLALGTCEYQKGNFSEAVRMLSQAAQEGAGETQEQVLFWLGKALTPVDKIKARAVYLQLRKLKPAGDLVPNVLYKLALLDFAEDQDDQGISHLMEIIKRFPESPVASEAMWEAGWRLYSTGEYDKAFGMFHSLKTSRFSTPAIIHQVSYWEARSAEKKGERDKALRMYLAFRDFPPGYYELLSKWRLFTMGVSVTPGTDQSRERPAGLSATLSTAQSGTRPVISGTARRHTMSPDLPTHVFYHYQRANDLNELTLKDDAIEEISSILEDGHMDKASLLHVAELSRDMEYYTLSQDIPRTYLQRDLEKRPQKDTLDSWIAAYPLGHSVLVEEYTKQYSLPPHLLYAVILEESRFRKNAVSRANALGLMQMIPPTGSLAAKRTRLKGFSPDLLFDPEINIGLGSWYLRQILLQFQGNLIFALASYNAGPHRILSWIEDSDTLEADEFVESIPFAETRDYVKKVLGSLEAYNLLFGGTIDLKKEITLPSGTGEKVDLKALGINNH